MQDELLIQQLNTHISQLVKLRLLLKTEVVGQVRFTTAQRSGASLLLAGCDYLIENLSALRTALAVR